MEPPALLQKFGGGSASTLAFAGLLIAFLAWQFRSWARLRTVPGPLAYSLSILPFARVTASGKMNVWCKAVLDKYGIIARVGPNEVLIGDADEYRRICSVRSPFAKGPWYDAARVVPDQDSIFSMRDEKSRTELKGKISAGYAGRDGANFELAIDNVVGKMVNLIERKYISTATEYRPVEFAHKAQYFTLDVISEAGFGSALGFLENDEDMHNYIHLNDMYFPMLVFIMNFPSVIHAMRVWPLSLALPKETDLYGFGPMMGFARGLVDKRMKADAKPGNDILQAHIRNGVTYKELIPEIFQQLIAGSDSSATALRMIILCLLTNPKAYAAVRREIAEGVAAGRISKPIRDAEAKKLSYLQAALKETLRMHPPVGASFYKEVPRGGATVCGHQLPQGAQVGICIKYVLRDPVLFGPDPEAYRPERWLEEKDEARLKEMYAAVDLVFGHGKFQCLGKTIAYMELNKVVVELVRRYDFAIVNALKPMEVYDAGFWVTNDFWLRVTRRDDAC